MNKRVYLIRHGQSISNVSPIFQGRNDSISEEGIRQMQAAAGALGDIELETIISSPLSRAVESARQLSADFVESELFAEIASPSEVYAKSHKDEAAVKLFMQWYATLSDPKQKIQDGENYTEIKERVDRALHALEEYNTKSIAVVTHSLFLRSLLARIVAGNNLSGPILVNFLENIKIDNSGITVIEYKSSKTSHEPRWHLISHNSTNHLRQT